MAIKINGTTVIDDSRNVYPSGFVLPASTSYSNVAVLTGGMTQQYRADGTIATGSPTTHSLTVSGGNFNLIFNNNSASIEVAAEASVGFHQHVILWSNNAGASTVTFTGFTKVTGDPLTTTNNHRFMFFITQFYNSFLNHLHIVALQ